MPQDDQNYVILVHGFLGSAEDFDDLKTHFQSQGYHVIAHSYSTFDGGVDELAEMVLPRSFEEAKDAKNIHIVTHSMGALLLRSYLANHKVKKLRRVVMIAPPNHGSEVADRMSEHDWWVDMFGDAGMDLRTSVKFPPMPKAVEFGVIGGDASWNYLSRDWIPGDDDGWVGIESTKLEGMKDYIQVSSSHGFITANESVKNQASYFLQHGHFASNIEMEGAPVDINKLDEFNEIAKANVDKLNAWYEKVFKEGDREATAKARAKLAGQVGDFNKWVDKWRKKLG